MRRITQVLKQKCRLGSCVATCIAERYVANEVPWKSPLPPPEDPRWKTVGNAIIENAQKQDSGPEAFQECMQARRQLETIVQAAGYTDMSVFTFGGVAVMRLLEIGGDIDFVAVGDVEPTYEESTEIISRLSREMRRLGMKSTAVRARVPVVKVDRVSRVMPGTPLHSLATIGIFQAVRALDEDERQTFATLMKEEYSAVTVEWNLTKQFATVTFSDTATLIVALTEVARVGSVEFPLRLPLEPRNGPELFRYPFDLCLTTMGLRNTYLLSSYLSMYPYARHLLMMLKKWGRACGIINSIDGLLATYATTVMCVHYLTKLNVIPKIDVHRVTDEPQLLPKEPQYKALEGPEAGDVAELGYLFANFFVYFGSVFNYEDDVVCVTRTELKKKMLKWERHPGMIKGRPPFFDFCIKDPFGLENIARNLNDDAAEAVKSGHNLAVDVISSELDDGAFLLNTLISQPPKPKMVAENASFGSVSQADLLNPSLTFSKGTADGETDDDIATQTEARRMLARAEFHKRKDSMQRFGQSSMRKQENLKTARTLTSDVVGWLRTGHSKEEQIVTEKIVDVESDLIKDS